MVFYSMKSYSKSQALREVPKSDQLTTLVTCQVYFQELLPYKVQVGVVEPEERTHCVT